MVHAFSLPDNYRRAVEKCLDPNITFDLYDNERSDEDLIE
jgi:hypothetical protein